MVPAFVQIHTLTTYPAALLNRDDAGFAKRLPFGGATRTRISSQCLKYHWRNFAGEHALYGIDVPRSVRSRETFKRLIARPLVEEGYPLRLVVAFALHLQQLIVSDEALSKADFNKLMRDEADDEALLDQLKSNQLIVLGRPEVDYLRRIIRERLDALREVWENASASLSDEQLYQELQAIGKGDLRQNLRGLRLAAGLDAALFGRMATSDVLARGDAAIHVAHAFTTHAEESESDYFTAVDELVAQDSEGELGSGHLNNQELTSGLFYSYVVVDVPLLVSNLEGVPRTDWQQADRTLAAEVVQRLLHLIATVSPGAKLGSTAPHAYAQFMLVEWGQSQPRTLANAFHRPVPLNGEGVLINSYRALGRYVAQMDRMYGKLTERRLAAIDLPEDVRCQLQVDALHSIPEIANWVAEKIREGT